MREEEQLAHDVYAVSAMLWAPPIFANISASEATHSASVKALIDRYQLVDPLAWLRAASRPLNSRRSATQWLPPVGSA